MKTLRTHKRLFWTLYRFLCFFALMAFLITCCMVLFLSVLSQSTGLVFTAENVRKAAIVTFANVLFLSFLLTLTDAFRRRLTVERPVREIVSAAERIAKGDYSVRIPPLRSLYRADGLDEIARCYNRMAEELAGIESMQTDFMANVSHELKTPLSVMGNYATLLQSDDLTDEERRRYARAVTETCRRMADLVSNLLRLNKLEKKQIFSDPVMYDLSEQLRTCLLSFESVWESKEISLSLDIEDEAYVKSDRELLSFVWNNLLSNALKFTEPGGTVSLSLHREGQATVVKVSDTGCGISPEVGKHMFEKFYQGDTSHATEGNGLGLALVRRIVDIVGADIEVESTVGQGSTFTVRLWDL